MERSGRSGPKKARLSGPRKTRGAFTELRFGTSGLRDAVSNMTDRECYINTRGFLAFLRAVGEFEEGCAVALGGDRRPSTPRIKGAVAAAVRDGGGEVDDQGLVSSPALALYAMKRAIPSIMVTGSHIPAGRNGIKFTKKSGEVLKSDEAAILASVAEMRAEMEKAGHGAAQFDGRGMFRTGESERAAALIGRGDFAGAAEGEYVGRYVEAFGPTPFPPGIRLFLYQHSAVARDALRDIFEALGAEVFAPDSGIVIEYEGEGGAREREAVTLRSREFVPVDTESVSEKTMAVFRTVMDENGLDIGISLDGDSDRPLLVYRDGAGGDVRYVTGDILGLLTVLALEEMGVAIHAVAVPVSANDAIGRVLGERGVEITRTRIGSPYVIAAMNASLADHPSPWNAFAWEANGGFLTGSDILIGGKKLRALPTRDAALPLLAVLLAAARDGEAVSDLLARLPARYTHADRKKKFPAEAGRAVIRRFSPAGESGVIQVDFAPGGEASAAGADGADAALAATSEFHAIRDELSSLFTPADGFAEIVALNYIDGVRISFSNGEISHLRPSGNAPEFRNYAIADTPARAREIVEIGLKKILPAMAKAAGYNLS